ncbi:DNA starvation/stationary phase protection protein Dps [Flavisphingomonas formosensis]|uniref:DNA starvation/stationary phase protection protein Dps n=1 Tax=Flavisphingomonas formosensis TaxID=861534 RepID=UPI0018E02A61|nr:DNA starvation/stationary phase protection protein Dps [Sphingomonas formosensis]
MRRQAVTLLQAALSDALDLDAQTKQAHWNVRGPQFLQLHELFDKLHDEVEGFVDLLAERITTLGHTADGRVQTTAALSTLYVYPLEARHGEAHLRALSASLASFGARMRAGIAAAESEGDADTADIFFTEISRGSDKQLWLIEAHLLDD